MESFRLCLGNLSLLNKKVSIPAYDRGALSPSIIHIGLGNFHRAHQAAYLDELLEKGIERQGIFGINLLPGSFPLGDILGEQDHLYSLVTKSPAGEEKIRVMGSILGCMDGAANMEEAIQCMADSKTSLITMTITEKGYYFDKKSGECDSSEAAVQEDLSQRERPKTAAAVLARALSVRYKNGMKPLTIMSCDNIPSNGKTLKKCVLFFCRELYPEIVRWVEDEAGFPCSMVDRITPVTTPGLVSEIEERYGIADRWPVCCEDFRQWVLEGDFRTQVPKYEEAGVQIVKDAEPYELMKMRLLNGSHSAMAYLSYLLGCRMVDEGIGHPLVNAFIRNHYMEEVTPTLKEVPGIDLNVYKDTLISRFSNKNTGDRILRLASEGTSKIPNFTLKPLSEGIQQGRPCEAIIFALAAWARFLEGKDEQGLPIPIEDSGGPIIVEAALSAMDKPEAFLLAAGLQGLSAAQLKAAGDSLKSSLGAIRARGTKQALEEFLHLHV